jgi:hypothetical protein
MISGGEVQAWKNEFKQRKINKNSYRLALFSTRGQGNSPK